MSAAAADQHMPQATKSVAIARGLQMMVLIVVIIEFKSLLV